MRKIISHLWFDSKAQEAAEFYAAALPDSHIINVTKLPDTPSGDSDLVSFQLAGQPFRAMSAGPLRRFNPSISFQVNCKTAEEVDALWKRLFPGGKILMPLDGYPFSQRYGWLEDKYGLSWQVMYSDSVPVAQTLMPMLMFVGEVCGRSEEAIHSYVSVFRDAPNAAAHGLTSVEVESRFGAGEEPEMQGTVRYARFSLRGQEFAAMDSAHDHKFAFNEAISFIVPCDTQEEIDYLWEELSADPSAEQCGWLKDKYGISWQITPAILEELLSGSDQAQTKRVTEALLKMKKFDIAQLEQAAAG